MDKSSFTPTWEHIKIRDNDFSTHTSTLYKNYVIFFGGVLNQPDSPTQDFYVYNLEANLGFSLQPTGDAVSPRVRHSACLYQRNRIIIFGGYTGLKPSRLCSGVGMLTLYEEGNLLKADYILLPCSKSRVERASHVAHIYKDKLFVFGGVVAGDVESNELWSLDLVSLQWAQHGSSWQGPGKRKGCSSVIVDDKIYIFGGSNNAISLGEIWILNLENLQWKQVTNNSPIQMSYGSALERNCNVYIFGGMRNLHIRPNEISVYNIESEKIETLQTEGEGPTPRANHTALCYKGKMLIFGGTYPKEKSNGTGFSLKLDSIIEEEAKFENIVSIPKMTKKKGKQESYTAVLQDIYNSKLYADITFQVQQQTFTAHKNILAARCKFFENMLASGMSESNSSTITIQDIQASTFEALIKFIYCNEVELNKELALDLLRVSDKYAFVELRNLCEEYLGENITLEDYVELAQVAEQIDAEILRTAIVKFVARYVNQIKLKENPGVLPPSIFWEIISYLASKRS